MQLSSLLGRAALVVGLASCSSGATTAGADADETKAGETKAIGATDEPAGPKAPPPEPAVDFVRDDYAGALAQAKEQGKALFVDAWAPWCHTCLSMHHYVFTDPAIKPLAERMVFAAVDTDRPENKAFADKYSMNMWPTLLVINPEGERVVGYWPGAASTRELLAFAERSLQTLDGQSELDPSSPAGLLAAAREAQARGDVKAAAKAYGEAARSESIEGALKSAALLGWIQTLKASRQWKRCVEVGGEFLDAVEGAARPVDFARYLAMCANNLSGVTEKKQARALAIARLRALTQTPPAGASVDDRADALDALARALERQGDRAAARAADEQRLALMEEAAKAAPTPEIAATYDYGRANAYVALGRAPEAIAMLERRERELPKSYEPPARLATVYQSVQRWPEALAAIERALERSYGPRKLRYMSVKADIQGRMNDLAGQVETLREEVTGRRELVRGDANRAAFEEARKRLQRAEMTLRSRSN